MNPSQHAEQFQSQLANYVPLFTPQFWPVWLIIAGLLLVGMWLVLGLHALLRARGVKKSATDHGEKVYLYSKAVRLWHWSNALLFVLLLASGLINHFALVGATAVKSLVAVHEVCGFLLLACWLGFVLINAVGGNGHHYRIRRQGWLERAAKQTRFYLFGIMQSLRFLPRILAVLLPHLHLREVLDLVLPRPVLWILRSSHRQVLPPQFPSLQFPLR